jgi:hypothetical protein
VAAVSKRTLLQALLAACLIGAIAPGAGLAQEGTSLERAIKATYLWKFAPFVEWPASVFKSPDSPFVIVFSAIIHSAMCSTKLSLTSAFPTGRSK